MAKRRANGEGNIRKRKDGRWEGRYTAGYDQDGKRIIKNVLGKTQAEVKAKLSVAIAESQQLDVSRSGEYTVAEWLRLWFELYAKPSIRPSTAGYYRRGIEQYAIPRIGAIKLNKLTSREIQKLYKDLLENGRTREQQRKKKPGLSGSTVRGVHTMLHSALDRAVKERLLIRNPADGCVVPKAQHQEMKTLRPEDLKAYLDAAERRNALAMFYLELVSGIRKGELVALRWEDLDIPNKTISVSKQATKDEDNHLIVARPKTENSIRLISIPQEAVELLIREHTKHPDSPWLFPSSRTGGMYHPDSVATLHQRILKDAGLEHLRFHDLRHTFATLALQNGVDIKTVSAMLGHYDAGFTLRTYTHTTRQKQDEAAQTMGNLMAQVRYQRGLTQLQVADMADIDVRTVMNIENYKANPKMEVLYPLVRALRIDARTIFTPELQREAPALQQLRLMVEECNEQEAESLIPVIESVLSALRAKDTIEIG